MKKEIFNGILCVLSMTITGIIFGIITKKDLQVGLLIAMIITHVITRTVVFIFKNKKS